MAGTNTEKPTGKQEQKKQQAVKDTTKSKKQVQQQNPPKAQEKKEDKGSQEKSEEVKETQKPKEEKKNVQKKTKKSEAVVNASDLPVSTKVAVAMCRFIKNKEISKIMKELDEVIKEKKPVPMKGEYAHKKGIMSGKYPVKAAKEFKRLLKTLKANSAENGIEKPVISTAIANKGQRPMARFGAWQRKRTHLKIIAKEKR